MVMCSSRRTIFAFLVASSLGGCSWVAALNPFAGSAPPSPAPVVPRSVTPANFFGTAGTQPGIITVAPPRPLTDVNGRPLPTPVYPRVQVLKLNLPVGTFSANSKVWKQLNEDAIDGKTSTLLAQNGLRAATGSQLKWPEIAKLIDVPGASTEERRCQTDNHSAVEFIMQNQVDSQTVFFVDSDLQLQGRTFDESTNVIRLSMNQPKVGSPITIQLEPVVRLPAPPPPERFAPNIPQPPNEVTFTNLRLAVTVEGKDFLVLAPSDTKVDSFSVGSRFLTDTEKTPATESVLVFVPQSEPMPAEKPKK